MLYCDIKKSSFVGRFDNKYNKCHINIYMIYICHILYYKYSKYNVSYSHINICISENVIKSNFMIRFSNYKCSK
jgi:hypothetical protein